MNNDIKKYTGAVNVNSDITPITREKIETVSVSDWPKMDINALCDQKIILNNRMVKALQAGHSDIAKQVQQGIQMLEAIINKKSLEENNKNGDLY